ncbi:MAG TPA: dUTP diphosphatase [Balneolaceae bacterium]|nr:dUTP diphosphatase [Balneolaceae bacterium]
MKNREIEVLFKRLEHAEGVPLPSRKSPHAAGLDIAAAVDEPVTLLPGERKLIPTGFQMAIPDGYEAQIRPRSGLALNCGITMLNSPGTIDSDYRGEVKVLAINHGQKTFVINRGERIAQMVIAPVQKVSIAEATELPETGRGEGGFGSTGLT